MVDTLSAEHRTLVLSTKQIFLIRHGETNENVLKMIQGREIDSALNDQGRKQSEKTGRYLAQHLVDKNNSTIYSSTQVRASETAKIINNFLNINIVESNDLVELKKGKLSGATISDENMQIVDETRKKYFEINKDPIKRNRSGIRGEHDFFEQELKHLELGTESYHETMDKIHRVIRYLITTRYSTIYVVSHSGFLDILIKEMFHTNETFSGDKSNGKNCWISLIEYVESVGYPGHPGYFKLITAPNTEHLALF